MSGFGLTDPVRKQAGVQELIRHTSGQCFRTYPDRMRIGSGMFTGLPGYSEAASNACGNNKTCSKCRVVAANHSGEQHSEQSYQRHRI